MNIKSLNTVYYNNGTAKVICSIKLSQKLSNDPYVTVTSPNNIVQSHFFQLKSLSTSHHIFIQNIKDGTYIDYINSIALCMLKGNIPCRILVAASYSNSFMVYSPETDNIIYMYLDPNTDCNILKNKCQLKYNELKSMASVHSDKY